MRILHLTDLHGSEKCVGQSRELIQEHSPDLVLVTGDITNFGPLSYARRFFEGLPGKVLGIPGNCDPPEIVSLLESMGVNLHEKREAFQGELIVGLGGSTPTPFHTPFEISEQEVDISLRRLMVRGAILATHAPPRGHVDVVPSSGHAGSLSVGALVDEFRPKLVLCGHIHEGRGVERGSITYVNPGPAFSGYAAVIDVEDEVEVTLLP
ncbi:MAG: metallophosphoesterase [Thermoplasmata archaeon]